MERRGLARMAERRAEIKRIENGRRDFAEELDAALVERLLQYRRDGYTLTVKTDGPAEHPVHRHWRVHKDGVTVGTFRYVSLTPDAERAEYVCSKCSSISPPISTTCPHLRWYQEHREKYPDVTRLNACGACGRTTFGKGSRLHADGCPKGSGSSIGGYWALSPVERVEDAKAVAPADGSSW